jgi:hypothetical protein
MNDLRAETSYTVREVRTCNPLLSPAGVYFFYSPN